MKEIVIVADLHHASPRMVLLSKYLQRKGVNAIIITPPLGRKTDHIGIPEAGFLEGLTVVETPTAKAPKGVASTLKEFAEAKGWQWYGSVKPLLRRLRRLYLEFKYFPDSQRNWKKAAVQAFEKINSTRAVSAIVSSSSPVTCHVIANRLSKRYGLPWIADLRDLWSQNHNYPYSRIRRFVEGWFERKTLRRASCVVTVTPDWAEKLRAFHDRNNVISITNGYDPDTVRPSSQGPIQGIFRVVYTGQIYPQKQDPGMILDAVALLIGKGVLPRRQVRLDFYGKYSEELRVQATSRGFSDVVFQNGAVPWNQIQQKQAEADVLLLLYWCDTNEKGWIPSKVFEYMAAGRPIIATGRSRDNIINRIFCETRIGTFCTTVDETVAAIEEIYRCKPIAGTVRSAGDAKAIKRYSWDYLSDQFLRVIDQVSKGGVPIG